MDVIKQRRLLTATAGGLLVATVGAVGWSVSALPDTPPTQVSVRTPSLDDSVPGPSESDPGANPQILEIALRGSLEDPKPPPQPKQAPPPKVVRQPAPKPEPKLELTVLGTVIDDRQKLAIIADPSGQFDIKGVGESLDLTPAGVSVQSIEPDAVTLVHNNKPSTFTIDKKRRKSKAPNNKRGRVR